MADKGLFSTRPSIEGRISNVNTIYKDKGTSNFFCLSWIPKISGIPVISILLKQYRFFWLKAVAPIHMIVYHIINKG